MPLTVGVDVGGTFTDVVVLDGKGIAGRKIPTTSDQAMAVADAARYASVDTNALFLHGTTAGTNALLEGRGAATALVTTKGFEDLVEIGRQARPSLYDSFADRPPSLAPRRMRFGYDGDADEVLGRIREAGPEAVAVALIRSFDDPSDEIALGERLGAALGLPISVGALVSPAFREYERIATTILNAYLTPEVSGYLARLDASVPAARRLAMTSSGGLLPFAAAASRAGRLVLSGPAAGVVAATAIGSAKGHTSVISFDMGGTSTDVCRIDGQGSGGRRHSAAGRVNRVPSMPIHTIGAGGGSLAWVDDGGALRVGPRSAGADPGPAAYGMGGEVATVTDANVVLGRIPTGAMLGGSVSLDVAAAERAVGRIGTPLGMSPELAAAGMIEVVDTHMEWALRAVSVEDGVDPRDSALVAFGGAGGLHATRLARRLGIGITLIPPLSGVFSALGLLLARPTSDVERTVMLEDGSSQLQSLGGIIAGEAGETFRLDHGVVGDDVATYADVRYVGQSHELIIPLSPDWIDLRTTFETTHLARFGFVRDTEPIELVNVRAVVSGPPPITWHELPVSEVSAQPVASSGVATIDGRRVPVPVWAREGLPPGFEARGPAVVLETDSAVWLEPDDRLVVDDDGTLRLTW